MNAPRFERQLIEDHRPDGYFLEAADLTGDGRADLVGYGLGAGEVTWYGNGDWLPTLITKLPGPVGMHHADVDGDGLNDIVICYQYGMTMVDCDPSGGKIIWLQNPDTSGRDWTARYIGRATSMHRLRVGHFTRADRLQVLAAPIVGEPHALHSITPLILFTQPDDVLSAGEWIREDIHPARAGLPADARVEQRFHVVHGITIGAFGSAQGSSLDEVLVASEEGVSWLRWDASTGGWTAQNLGSGELTEVNTTGFKGSGDVAAGRIGDDPLAYLAAVEPFHGNTVAVYVKEPGAAGDGLATAWRRVVLDVFGDPNALGEGPGHYVVCADFDNDGDDEFLVALRGPMPWQGVFLYKAIDVANGVFVKWRVSDDSAARIAVADFDGDGRLDFATIGYSVGGYYMADNPAIVLFRNVYAPA
jgi:hypothetical protein